MVASVWVNAAEKKEGALDALTKIWLVPKKYSLCFQIVVTVDFFATLTIRLISKIIANM
jgi:NRPS condensation-like uncharacterized protein